MKRINIYSRNPSYDNSISSLLETTMRLKFTWHEESGKLIPTCDSSDVNTDGISLIACLLMDDGGLPYQETLGWIDKGIATLLSTLREGKTDWTWDRESWGATLSGSNVKIYSLHDENYYGEIQAESFKSILDAWRNFISAKDYNAQIKMDV